MVSKQTGIPKIAPCPDLSGMSAVPAGKSHWTADRIPDLSGRRYLITGGAGDLGRATAQALAERGAQTLLADINPAAGRAAADAIQSSSFYLLDLADLDAVTRFSQYLCEERRPLDGLINIAGIIPPVQRHTTRNGLELTMAVNMLGHFAMTAQLLPVLLASASPRVVSISSITQAWGRLDFNDLQFERRYIPNKVYAATKLACLMFGLALHDRAQATGSRLMSVVAHPGIARTRIGQERRLQERGLRDRVEDWAQAVAMRVFGQSASQAVNPILFAAVGKEAVSGGFYGPDGFGQFSGNPVAVRACSHARDPQARCQLWQAAEKLTGQTFAYLENAKIGT